MIEQAAVHLEALDTPPSEIEVRNPVTGDVIERVPNSSAEAVREAVSRARQAQPAWAALPVKQRARLLKAFGKLLIKRQERMIGVIRAENGKARGGAFGEVAVIANTADYYARHAEKWLRPERRTPLVRGLYTIQVHHKPLGVVGNISPWNYPLVLAMIDMIPALIAGNAVVVKPSEITPLTALEAATLLRDAGLPENVFQVVTGYGETGAALIDEVDFIMFTGSTATGRKVAVKAAERLIPYSLELGGNAPFVVLRDADLKKAAGAAVAAGFENTGQLCMSVQRVIVEDAVYEPFIEQAKKWHAKLKIGTGDTLATHCGSLTNQRELERTQAHIQDALSKGARLIAGGNPLPEIGPLFHEATLLADVQPDMLIMREEVFGPVVGITKASDAEEALQIANNSQYGLTSSLWSKDIKRAESLALRIEAGDVNMNTALLNLGMPDSEFGGVKESGVGRRNGKQGLLKYTVAQSLCRDNFPLDPGQPTVYTRKIVFLLNLSRRLKRWLPFLGS